MSDWFMQETFFRPPALVESPWTIPAEMYNRAQLLLRRGQRDCVYVPIRSMQFQAILDRDEIIFIDSQGGYCVQDGQGGRIILIAWRFADATARQSLAAPMPCTVIRYQSGLDDVQRRLLGEFGKALRQLEERGSENANSGVRADVIPIRRPGI